MKKDKANSVAQRDVPTSKKRGRGRPKGSTAKSNESSVAKKLLRVKKEVKHLQKETFTKKDSSNKNPASRENEHYTEYLHLYTTLQEMVRIGEEQYLEKKQTRDVYALMAMYSQLREVIADIRTITDSGEQAQMLVEEVLQPLISSITQLTIDSFYHLKMLVREIAKDKEIQYGLKKLDNIMRDHGKFIQDQYQRSSEKLFDMMVEH